MKKTKDDPVICPFTVLVDSAEQHPFKFCGIKADSKQQYRPLVVKTEWRALGRHPNSLGDYSIDGFVGRVHVERKSIQDFQSTLLSFSDRRTRFERELSNLAGIEAPLVVVEGTLLAAIQVPEHHSQKSSQTNAKILLRSVLAFQQDYRVPWLFCDNRRLAELATFRFLERFWRKEQERLKEAQRLIASI